MTVEIRGAEQLANLAKDLKAAGDKELQKELSKAISAQMRPVMNAVRQSAKSKLPSRGGLAAQVAGSKMSTRRYAGSRRAGIRLVAKNAYALNRLDQGKLRHPVFADPQKTRSQWTWVDQPVAPGWWTEPTEAAAPEVRKALEAAMQGIADRIGRH